MAKTLDVKLKEAYDTEANWKTTNPVLLAGQLAFSSDKNGRYKIGDGIKNWVQLPYNTLSWSDISGKPSTFNPTAHNHTISQVTDIGNASVKYATTSGTANAVAWANVSGKPGSFNPSTHTHDDRYYTETEMNTKLGEKANLSHSHNYAGSSSSGGSANSAVKLTTARTINGVAFDGTKNIEIQNNYSKQLSSEDLNTVLSLGNYHGAGGNTVINKPSGVEHFGMTNFKVAGGYITQLLYGSDNKLYYRLYNGTSFSNWFDLYSDTNKPTKSDVGLGNVDNTADVNKSVKYATSAGSATNATTATKLGTATKGSATQPIYLNAGVPTACTYTLGKSVPSNAVFTDTNTWIPLKGATSTDSGTAGYAPAPSAGAANRYLRSDGTWSVPPDTNTTYGVVSTTANGLAPKRDGSTAHFLRGDGTWATPPNTTYSVASGSTNGLMSSTDKTKLDGIATGANKYVLPTAGLNALGGVKTTSQVTSASGYTACPIIGGVPYYKDTNTTYTLSSFGITATAAELNFCDGVTSNIQTQLNGKAASSHSHTASQITGLPNVVAITNTQIDSLASL